MDRETEIRAELFVYLFIMSSLVQGGLERAGLGSLEWHSGCISRVRILGKMKYFLWW